jgi:methanesulfonate monooxygenase small subunit
MPVGNFLPAGIGLFEYSFPSGERMMENNQAVIESIKSVIYESCIALNDQKWMDWIALCDDSFEYAIKAFSPEIGSQMTYMAGNRDHMDNLLKMLPKHNSDNSPLKRHCVVYRVVLSDDGKAGSAISSVVVYQTQLDGINSHVDAGETNLFLAANYYDEFVVNGDDVKMTKRDVQLDTRRLDKGTHWPI